MATNKNNNNKPVQSLWSLFSGTSIPASLLVDASVKVKRDNEIKDFHTYEEWLDFNKKSLIKRYVEDFNSNIKNKNKKKSIEEKMKDWIHNHEIFSVLSTHQIVSLYVDFYNIKDAYFYKKKILFIVNIFKRIEKVVDKDFNIYIIKALKDDANKMKEKTKDYELKAVKKIEVLTLKYELEKGLLLKEKQIEKKWSKI